MPGLSKVIVVDPDARARRQLQLGFEREGVPTASLPADSSPFELPGDDTGLVVVGGIDGEGLELVRRVRALLDERRIDAPIVFAGRGVRRGDATAAGADEVVLAPAYLRDVVTVGRLLRGLPAAQRVRLVGSLVEITGVYTLVRALAALGRSATLTLMRGLRRGEIRFYHGEITSAQVGIIHGQAALHQLLLWTDARFDFHHEDIVRRQQIPLTRDEVFAGAERFLQGVRDSSGGLSPSMVLEPNAPRVQALSQQIPAEVYGVLRMFDGYRLLVDVLEDSAYRVFETLRVAQRAVEVGLLRVVDKQPQRATWRTVLAIEDWLVGRQPRAGAEPVPPPAAKRAAPTGERDARDRSGRKRRRKKRRVNTTRGIGVGMGVAPQSPEIDWGALVPRLMGAEVGPLAGVVPATHVSGELIATAPARAPGAVDPKADTGPTVVVFDEAAEARAKSARVSAEAPRVVDDLLLADTKPERVARAPATPPGGLAVAESSTATVVVHDIVTVEMSGATTARITATPSATVVVHGGGADDASATATAQPTTPLAAKLVGVAATRGGPGTRNAPRANRITDAAPAAITDEPSDGIVRQHIVTAETAPVKRRRLPTDPPDDDRPDDATGEITLPRAQTAEPLISEPSILVADLAALHSAVSKLGDDHAHAMPVAADAASPSRDAAVAEARRDAVAFSEAEEAFFRAGHDKKVVPPPAPTESFDDLDEGYRPVGFWGRLRGKALPPDKQDKPDKK